MLNQILIPLSLSIIGFILVYMIYKRSENVSVNLTVRRAISIALLVFLISQAILSGDKEPMYFTGALICMVVGSLFLGKRKSEV